MKITRISVYQVDLPLEHPYWLSGGRLKFECLDATFVKVETDAGITGWGEGTPWGHTYVPAHGPGIRAGIETMASFVWDSIRAGYSMSSVRWILHYRDTSTRSHRLTWRVGILPVRPQAFQLLI